MDLLTSMRAFVLTVERGSYRQAADALEVSPTMIAKHVAALERRIGGRLMHRTTRRQGLTLLGEAYHARCRRILAEVAEADVLAQVLDETVAGAMRISAPPTFGAVVLAPLLAAFLERYPQVRADVRLTARKVDLLGEGVEAAFRVGAVEEDGLVARTLPPYRMLLAASPAYLARAGVPGSPADLSRHDVIAFPEWQASRTWRLEHVDGVTEVAVTPRLVIDGSDAARRAALAGLGIALQSELALREDLATGRLVRVLEGFAPPSQPMHLVYLPDRRRPVRLERFIAFALAALHAA